MEVELGKKIDIEEVKDKILKHFSTIFETEFIKEKTEV
jgi:lipoyl(octanoyl) transferase